MDLLPKSSLQSTKVQRTLLLPVSFLKLLDEQLLRLNRKAKIHGYSLRNNFPSKTNKHDTVEKHLNKCETSSHQYFQFPENPNLSQPVNEDNNFSDLNNLQSCFLLFSNIFKRLELEIIFVFRCLFQIVFWKLK